MLGTTSPWDPSAKSVLKSALNPIKPPADFKMGLGFTYIIKPGSCIKIKLVSHDPNETRRWDPV
jgi:hypothetical protein